MILQPRKVSFKRLLKFSGYKHAHKSLMRSLQYEAIEGLHLPGRTLDAGGGVHNTYWSLMKYDHLDSANIDTKIGPTYLCDLNDPLPVKTGTYDHVVSLNTLEHVYGDRAALREFCRVLKPGGSCHIVVPFLIRFHGPPDFHRHTGRAWIEMMKDAGFDPESIVVEPLSFGRWPSMYGIMEAQIRNPIKWALKVFFMSLALLSATLRPRHETADFDMPSSYYIIARKPQAG